MAETEDKLDLQPFFATDDPNGNEPTLGGDFVVIAWGNFIKLGTAILVNSKGISDQAETISEYDKTIEEHAKSIVQLSKALAGKADGLYVNEETNQLWLKSGDELIGTGIDLPKNGGGVPNVSDLNKKYDYASNQEARNALPEEDRKKGQVITYQLLSGEWILDMFIGDSVGSWSNAGSWRSFLTSADLTEVVTDIGTLKQKVSAMEPKINNIPADFDLDENNKLYMTNANGERINDGLELPAGGGGGTSSGVLMRLRIVGLSSMTVGEGKDVFIKYSFSSTEQDTGDDTGPGTYTVSINGVNVASGAANQGENSFNLRGYIFLGSNMVKIRVVDSEGNAKTVTWNIEVATLTLTSTFSDETVYNTNPIPFRYTPVGIGEKTVRFFLAGNELSADTIDTSGRQITKNLTGLTNGSHSLRVFAESTIEGSALSSNELYYEFIYADATATAPIIALSYNKTVVEQFSKIDIPFLVYNPASPTANVTIRVNGQVASQMEVPRSKQHFTYQANTEGALTIVFTCGAESKTLNIEVAASGLNITEESGDLEYKAFAVGKSNSGNDRDKWEYNGHTTDFENFLWADDGWKKDDKGNSCLRLIGDSKAKVNINPFAGNVLITGATLTVEYSTKEVTDDKAVVMSSMFAGIGVEFTPTSVTLRSAQSILSARFDSNEKISVSLVVQKLTENRLVYLFVDGIASGTLLYPVSDNFTQSTQQPFVLSTGERACQLQVYGIRWYRNSLNFDQILGNYIFDIENLDNKMTVYARNQIVDAYDNIDYAKALQFLPCMTIIGEMPTFKGDKKDCDIIYEDRQNPANSFTSQGAQNDVQGTSSQYYPRKNFKFKGKNGFSLTESGQTIPKYPLGGAGIPTSVFCLKADFAESSGTHNTGIAVLVDTMLKQMGILVPPQQSDNRIRTTIDGFPILLFQKENAASPATFVGKYNFNFDKGSEEVFAFKPGNECWEFKNNTSQRSLFKSDDFSGNDWLNDFEARYPDGYEDPGNLAGLFAWVVSCVGNPAKFKAECDRHFNVQGLLFYYLITEFYAMTDQRAKNQFLTTYGERGSTGKPLWWFLFYDNDTTLGINNEGKIAFEPNVEDQDRVDSGYAWNGWDSELWKLVKLAYTDEIQAMYQQLRQQQILSDSKTLDVLQSRQANKWCELVYNKDGKFKYIDPLLDSNEGAYLYALQGSRSRHRVWWLNNRFPYMDGKYFAGNHMNDYVNMRLYTPAVWKGVAPNADFKLTMAKGGYTRVKYGSYVTNGIRGVAGNTYTIAAPPIQFNDTETIVYGASALRSLGDLSAKYPGTVDITKAYALEDLIIGSTASGYKNENLADLHTGANAKLRKINVANCPNLTQALALGKCYSIEEIEARGSGITGIELPASGVLKKLYLPATFAALILKNQPYMETLSIEGYANINTVVIDNVPGVDGYAFVKNCVNTAGSKLSKVRLVNIDASDMNSATLNAIAQMTGEDENGLPTNTAVLTGKIVINQITQGALERFTALWPNLEITAVTILQVIDFADNIVKNIMVDNYDSNGDGEVSPIEVDSKVLPTGILSDSGAKSFNEAHYWRGAGSKVDLCETLESVSVLTGRTTIQTLPLLKKVHIYQGPDESMDASPLLRSAMPLTNCYDIENWILSGRYIENSKKGVIMGRQNDASGTFYQVCYPMKGYKNIAIDEPCSWDDANEASYPHGREIENIVLNALHSATISYLPNLKTITITGHAFSAAYPSLSIGSAKVMATLQEVRISGTKFGSFTTRAHLSGTGAKHSWVIEDGVITTPATSTIGYASAADGNPSSNRQIAKIDLGVNVNSTIRVTKEGYGQPHGIGTLIIRNPNAILPLTSGYSTVEATSFDVIYVPDDLLAAYKAATNWSIVASKFKALSLLSE